VVDGYAREPGEDYPPSMEWRPDGMQRITVDAVLRKVERALARYPAASVRGTTGVQPEP
jgi:hypothetical protein